MNGTVLLSNVNADLFFGGWEVWILVLAGGRGLDVISVLWVKHDVSFVYGASWLGYLFCYF